MFLQTLVAAVALGVSAPRSEHAPLRTPVPLAILPPGEIGADDISRADVDGPHVFYRSGRILVKSVERRDSSASMAFANYSKREVMPALACHVVETDDRFSFRLRERLATEPDTYEAPKKMLVVSDIEGNFRGFKQLLVGTGVMDKRFNWKFGDGHLVMVGDFFDRGLNVTEVLWLIYKLEAEAEAAGGRVHFIIGNHEVLNMEGDTRYVRNKYLENAEVIGEGYDTWFSAETELGRWLRTKNAIEKIGDVAFCHGGISREIFKSGMTLRQVNATARQFFGTRAEWITEVDAKQVFDTKTGIFWFRDMAKKQVSAEHVTEALAWAGVSRLVIGHTLMADITATYGGRVFCVDVYHDENLRQGFMKSLWIENGAFFGINDEGEKSAVFTVAFSKT